jgi:hypothetical protein
MPATISVNFATSQEATQGTLTNKSINPATLKAVLDSAGGTGSGYVTIAGAQTITGAKAFTSTIASNSISISNGNVLQIGGVSRLYGSAQDSYVNARVLQNLSSTLPDGMYINYASSGSTGSHIRFYANGVNERMIIRADNGRVGINTGANPRSNLDVNGTAEAHVFNASGADNIGRCVINRGNSANMGYVEWYRPNGTTRTAYMGFGIGDNLIVQLENGTSSLAVLGGNIYTNGQILINNSAPTVYLQDTDHNTSMLHCNSHLLYILRGNTNSINWNTLPNGRWPAYFNLLNGDMDLGGNYFARGVALVEYGENVNGSYVKLNNGVLICWVTLATFASNILYWNFPAQFTPGYSPIIVGSALTTLEGRGVVIIGNKDFWYTEVRRWRANGTADDRWPNLIAIGRCF